MNDLLKGVIEGNGITPPRFCLDAFNKNFEGALNIEWFHKNTHYEAIFYKNNIEHLASFSDSGGLEEYKMFLPDHFLPETIKANLLNKGEIMNVVLINKGNSIFYEAIIRDHDLKRHLILLSDFGVIVDEKPL